MKKKSLRLILTLGLVFSLTACQKENSENTLPEKESLHQTEAVLTIEEETEAIQTVEEETEASNQAEESSIAEEMEAETAAVTEKVQNEFFSITLDSFSEVEEFYVFTFLFTTVNDIAYYKGDELYQPGESWEKKVHIKKEKIADYCKNATYIHYKLYDASVYDENAQLLFAGGASFNLNEELEVYNLKAFEDIPIVNE